MNKPIPHNPPPARDYEGWDKPMSSRARFVFALGVILLCAVVLIAVFRLDLGRCIANPAQAATQSVAQGAANV
jgi:hypothetical protein